MSRQIDFYYFSGTGNTHLAAGYAAHLLREQGCAVVLRRLEQGFAPAAGDAELWFAIPANAQAVSPFVWRFFKKLPRGAGQRVYVLLTLNESAYVLTPLKKLLLRRGYQPTGSISISMPNNMIFGAPDTEQDMARLNAARDQIAAIAADAAAGKAEWMRKEKGSAFLSFFARNTTLPWTGMRVAIKLTASPDRCTGCGACAAACPVQNICIQDKRALHGDNCQFCLRCTATCPAGAVTVPGKDTLGFRTTPEEAFGAKEK